MFLSLQDVRSIEKVISPWFSRVSYTGELGATAMSLCEQLALGARVQKLETECASAFEAVLNVGKVCKDVEGRLNTEVVNKALLIRTIGDTASALAEDQKNGLVSISEKCARLYAKAEDVEKFADTLSNKVCLADFRFLSQKLAALAEQVAQLSDVVEFNERQARENVFAIKEGLLEVGTELSTKIDGCELRDTIDRVSEVEQGWGCWEQKLEEEEIKRRKADLSRDEDVAELQSWLQSLTDISRAAWAAAGLNGAEAATLQRPNPDLLMLTDDVSKNGRISASPQQHSSLQTIAARIPQDQQLPTRGTTLLDRIRFLEGAVTETQAVIEGLSSRIGTVSSHLGTIQKWQEQTNKLLHKGSEERSKNRENLLERLADLERANQGLGQANNKSYTSLEDKIQSFKKEDMERREKAALGMKEMEARINSQLKTLATQLRADFQSALKAHLDPHKAQGSDYLSGKPRNQQTIPGAHRSRRRRARLRLKARENSESVKKAKKGREKAESKKSLTFIRDGGILMPSSNCGAIRNEGAFYYATPDPQASKENPCEIDLSKQDLLKKDASALEDPPSSKASSTDENANEMGVYFSKNDESIYTPPKPSFSLSSVASYAPSGPKKEFFDFSCFTR